MNLSILCITRAEGMAMSFLEEMAALAERIDAELVIGADGEETRTRILHSGILAHNTPRIIVVSTHGYQENAQDELIVHCSQDYVLRLDDDERCSSIMEQWLCDRCFLSVDNWQFARAWMWNKGYIVSLPHWPDHQTRLSIKAKAGGRHSLHMPCPYGVGEMAPGAIEHYKLIMKSREEREQLLQHYDARQPGAGEPFRIFYVPESAAIPPVVQPWNDHLTAKEAIRRSEKMGMPMAQHGAEILPCVEWLLERIGRPTRVLEIGTEHGGTAALWCELATKQVVSVDMPFGIHGGLAQSDMDIRNGRLQVAYPHFSAIIGNSQLLVTRNAAESLLGGKLDLLFIDGDHRYHQAKTDYEMYRSLVRSGGVILFHDINRTSFYDSLDVTVYRLWQEFVGEKHEFNIHHEQWGGLGALVV